MPFQGSSAANGGWPPGAKSDDGDGRAGGGVCGGICDGGRCRPDLDGLRAGCGGAGASTPPRCESRQAKNVCPRERAGFCTTLCSPVKGDPLLKRSPNVPARFSCPSCLSGLSLAGLLPNVLRRARRPGAPELAPLPLPAGNDAPHRSQKSPEATYAPQFGHHIRLHPLSPHDHHATSSPFWSERSSGHAAHDYNGWRVERLA